MADLPLAEEPDEPDESDEAETRDTMREEKQGDTKQRKLIEEAELYF